MKIIRVNKAPPQSLLVVVLFLIVFSIPFMNSPIQGSPSVISTQETRSYQLRVTTHHASFSSEYYGIETVHLNSSNLHSYHGILFWNLSYDGGDTWVSDSVEICYGWNRTYQYNGLRRYTAWWIPPTVTIGAQITIHGDPPATNNHPRLHPFTVTDLVSIKIDHEFYLCWQLTYTTDQQHESYYYDFHTGLLLQASTTMEEEDQTVHEIELKLESADPAPPPIHPIIHLWVSYYSFILASFGATLIAVFVYYLVQQLQLRNAQSLFLPPPGNARLKNEPKTPAHHPSTGE